MSNNTSTHYVARTVVEKVTKVEKKSTTTNRGYRAEEVVDTERTVEELANFTVKGRSMYALREKVQSHIGLVTDPEDDEE